ncbi:MULTISPECIES: MSMEG_0570 family nitrogen starvation response protein [unclassified Roseofilum]|uniref:MSMEG_0570 family nitrogen starvation response protein n=1 Tax=unclassified Roseofilum TaxID=2620099 RepID=UPI000E7EF839|nr:MULTISPECIES: MSMEG_0570 family nitrogen starvation response protein [unclassified Roseofilum]HBQ99575.1 MSMEG_0570 family nitrogen starvation response protein [Cyanobacteria bacterium UBA11691]MBP0007864.1 MSMEG_0570 family nitrogen starvation response protein [Roseofilum sp. Belize Diploria]MBP0014413.1 MSMEG_0570 family nitrogen starvation response protein [Roseofilum sp. SID3]MBP0026524.1 MSMEG_0570 family nitrogen starvation response protein [Roseofilum sp. SID2]MBP0033208.1 MSMEG_0570
MPEIRFEIEWPDGIREVCYSPSLVVQKHLTAQTEYELANFMVRSRTALQEGSDRVKAKYGFACSLALGQLKKLETASTRYSSDAKVKVLQFIE